ncbi:MAG TPA: Gfo/Idh/MocA family oxidoreductase [Bryobacteraceae bacterium]|nr:Gfo/Idh/MocA family oxidoreductase [Bryobacteraceae bacterium]
MARPEVLIVGGGMITHDQLLPSLYHIERQGRIGSIAVCASRFSTVRDLARAEMLLRAFPGQTFRAYPDREGAAQPELFREAIAALPPRQIVVAAVPDQLHYEVVMTALRHDQHVLCVKPLALAYRHAVEIAREARLRRLLVAVEYHKRFDDRSLVARRKYRAGAFGEFRLGSARLFEKWYYRHSNFQNWMTAEHSDAFTYIGCHYVDLVHFITGLLPVAVSVYGVRDRFPNGKEGFLWTDARVIWNNGACLNVQNGLGFPDGAPGTNAQGMALYCGGNDQGGLIEHSDQYRGLKYSYTSDSDGVVYAEPSPDYFQYVDLGGPGLTPVGYGYRSVENIISKMMEAEARPELLDELEHDGIIATPGNSSYNEQVIEAGRQSILNGGCLVTISPRSQ